MRNLSLRYKLFLSMAFTLILFALFSILFVTLHIRNALKKEVITDGKIFATTVANHIVDDILINDFVKINAFFDEIIRLEPEISYILIEKDGRALLHTFEHGVPRGLQNIGHNKAKTDYIVVKSDGETYYDIAAPIFEGKAGILRVGMSGERIDKLSKETIISLLYITAAGLFISLVFSSLIAKRLIIPVSTLTTTALKISDGDYSKFVEIHGDDEVGKLSKAFNKMVDAVKIRETELRQMNEELETVNVRLHKHIEELDRTKDELVKSKQDMAVIETIGALLHHMSQPLTILILAAELAIEEIQKGDASNPSELLKKLKTVEEAGTRLSSLLKKIRDLKEYKTIEYADKVRILDIDK